jgi:hypothetical protein
MTRRGTRDYGMSDDDFESSLVLRLRCFVDIAHSVVACSPVPEHTFCHSLWTRLSCAVFTELYVYRFVPLNYKLIPMALFVRRFVWAL